MQCSIYDYTSWQAFQYSNSLKISLHLSTGNSIVPLNLSLLFLFIWHLFTHALINFWKSLQCLLKNFSQTFFWQSCYIICFSFAEHMQFIQHTYFHILPCSISPLRALPRNKLSSHERLDLIVKFFYPLANAI